ncbi:hypothetical protein QBC35DRAFT_495866 [Podospora australis]|uniref:Uncharacterized protein n=1 Tax=Podospora australis TaxID=1536484 RepID=A0AAN7AJR6_9PEZI|nr:hypothetical protein QBC35DRAFT_495866 [Podospora australis]
MSSLAQGTVPAGPGAGATAVNDKGEGTIDKPPTEHTGTPTESFIDSGYATTTNTPKTSRRRTLSKSLSNPVALLFSGPKKGPVPVSGVEIDQVTRARFATIQPHFERLLLEHVRSGQKRGARYRPMSTRIMMMRTIEGETLPHIVVFCQPGQQTVVDKFAKQEAVRDICRPGELGVPSFEVAVVAAAPRLRRRTAVINAIGEAAEHSPVSTLCGLPITVQHLSGELRNSTLGGVIKVTMGPGDFELYGITVGHVLESEDEEEDIEADDMPDAELDSEEDAGSFQRSQEREGSPSPPRTPMSSVMENHLLEQALPIDPSPSESLAWSFSHPETIGTLAHSRGTVLYEAKASRRSDYDWALFEMSTYKANQLASDKKARIVLSELAPGAPGRRPVCMISASSGVKMGHLEPDAGRIILGMGEELIDTHILTVDEDSGRHFPSPRPRFSTQFPNIGVTEDIHDGDSGSWVVDRETIELYGHLVATDHFNAGYVVPMCDILNDIKRHIGAVAVELPETPDFLHGKVVTPRDHLFEDMKNDTFEIWEEEVWEEEGDQNDFHGKKGDSIFTTTGSTTDKPATPSTPPTPPTMQPVEAESSVSSRRRHREDRDRGGRSDEVSTDSTDSGYSSLMTTPKRPRLPPAVTKNHNSLRISPSHGKRKREDTSQDRGGRKLFKM